MRCVALMLSLAMLAGCGGTAAERDADVESQAVAGLIKMVADCESKIGSSADFIILSARTPLRPPLVPSFAERADQDLPSQEEIAELIQWHELVLPCHAAFITGLKAAAPFLVDGFEAMDGETDAIYLQLATAAIPWGRANLALETARQHAATRTMTAQRQWSAEEQARIDHEAAARREVWAGLVRDFVGFMAEGATYRRITDCTRIGNTTTCTSW